MPFYISKKYLNTDWTKLNLTDDKSSNWTNGIEMIEDRFSSRFFNQIDKIKNDEFSGFVIMSIDCLLIETLMQFYLGVDNTEINYRGEHWKSFRDFFRNSSHFKAEFKTDAICKTFYRQFRCGLLHQAQTKQKSLIKICQPALITLADPNRIEAGLIIDRIQFHNKLVLEFNEYIDRLKFNEDNFANDNLRTRAINKMKLLCSD